MRPQVVLTLIAGTAVLAATIAQRHSRQQVARPEQQMDPSGAFERANSIPETSPSEPPVPTKRTARAPFQNAPLPTLELPDVTNRLERLARIQESFRALAAGDKTAALQAAKEITNGTERETALLTLVKEWTRGDLRPPLERARAISFYGLEAGLGMELVKDPELAILWANEITDGPGRAGLMQQTAIAMTASDPGAAFALSEQLPENERRIFFNSVFAGWAQNDTGAALAWAEQLTEPAEREAALQAIRSVAPVGIGTAVRIEDGYAVINQLLPGTPAELSGQLHPGDRIVALAQGDNAFVDAHGMALKDIVDMIRGAPGSVLKLQVLSADAPPGSQPQVVSITRDQIKFKR